MAVTTTPRDILVGAYAKSTKNRPGTIATEATELLQLVIRIVQGLYTVAARVDQTYFAAEVDKTFSSGWPRPQEAESIFRMERTALTTGGTGSAADLVNIVPFDDRGAEKGLGAVYRMGQTYQTAGNAPDPTGGTLRFFYAKRPSDPANLDAALDALWTEQHNELLMLEVAMYLALKDERAAEVADLRPQRDGWARLFISHLEHSETNVRRRWGHVQRIETNTLVPLSSLFAGGADLTG